MTMLAAAVFAAACSSGPLASQDNAPPKASDIRALRWLAPGADRVKALTMRPVACSNVKVVAPPGPGAEGVRFELGRLAFESPALLGGAAARMGLSCSSCHLNGRGNADFFLEGVSDKPGTADVTSSLISKVRGDGNFNPVLIPDLAARDGKQIRDRGGAEFRTRVHGLVVEEFDGQEPPGYVFEALLDYLDTLDVAACPDREAQVPVTAERDLSDADSALKHASWLAQEGRREDASLMARVARSRLERLHERFVARDQADVRNALVAASRAIETWSTSMRDAQPATQPRDEFARAYRLVEEHAERSLYNPSVLRAALKE